MIQDSQEDVLSRVAGDVDTEDFGIEQENLGMAYQAFLQYSNPIGSIVREITSNAWDATVEAGNDDPVVIEMSQKYPPDDERWIAFKDNGTGLVPLPRHTPDGRKAKEMFKKGKISEDKLKSIWETIEEKMKEANVPSMLVYKNFFSSTKRDIIDQLGYFGLGAKSPLGYTDMFEIITYREGWKYHYTVRKGKEKPQLDLLNCEETDAENGTTVRVPIKSRSDWQQFIDSIETQLAYFDNVVFEGGAEGHVVNDFTIYRGDHIIYRPDAPFDTMHICLGTVYYPLDFDVMNIKEGYYNSYKDRRKGHKVPIGLYFPLEDQKKMPIKVVWNRESVEYNDKTKDSINQKLEKAKKEIQELYEQQYEDISSIEEWYKFIATDRKDSIVINEDVSIPVTDEFVDEPNILPPGFENFFEKSPSDPFYMLEFHRKVEDGYIDQDRDDVNIKNLFANRQNYNPVYITDKKFTTKKNKWISNKIKPDGSEDFLILRAKDMPSDYNDVDDLEHIKSRFNSYYREGRDHDDDPSVLQLKAMLEFETQAVQVFREVFRDYDSVTVSESFQPRKHSKNKKQNKWANYDRDKKFPLKESSTKDSHSDDYGWSRKRWKYEYLETLDQRGTLVIYGHNSDDERLKKVMELLDNIGRWNKHRYGKSFDSKKLHVVKIAKSRRDMFEELRGSYHVDNFWESDHRIFRKVVTAFAIKEHLPDRKLIRKWKDYIPKANSIYQELSNLKSTYSFSYDSVYDGWVDDLLDEKKHLVDEKKIRKLEVVKGYVLKYPLLTWLERGTPRLNGLSSELDLDQELRKYIEDRPSIDPHLLYRYKRQKNQQDNGT